MPDSPAGVEEAQLVSALEQFFAEQITPAVKAVVADQISKLIADYISKAVAERRTLDETLSKRLGEISGLATEFTGHRNALVSASQALSAAGEKLQTESIELTRARQELTATATASKTDTAKTLSDIQGKLKSLEDRLGVLSGSVQPSLLQIVADLVQIDQNAGDRFAGTQKQIDVLAVSLTSVTGKIDQLSGGAERAQIAEQVARTQSDTALADVAKRVEAIETAISNVTRNLVTLQTAITAISLPGSGPADGAAAEAEAEAPAASDTSAEASQPAAVPAQAAVAQADTAQADVVRTDQPERRRWLNPWTIAAAVAVALILLLVGAMYVWPSIASYLAPAPRHREDDSSKKRDDDKKAQEHPPAPSPSEAAWTKLQTIAAFKPYCAGETTPCTFEYVWSKYDHAHRIDILQNLLLKFPQAQARCAYTLSAPADGKWGPGTSGAANTALACIKSTLQVPLDEPKDDPARQVQDDILLHDAAIALLPSVANAAH